MGAYAIAVCFSQSLMRAEVQTTEALMHSKTVATITNVFLSDVEEIFGDKGIRKKLLMKHQQS